ncbi:MAG: hypothetical protein Q8K20_16490 [Gemmobacter sp.]|nr:hypothetical protein [Gemmobacter sp.]
MPNALVRELPVSESRASVAFSCGMLGFGQLLYPPEEWGTNLALLGADRMLDHPGVAGPAARLGRGVNLQIAVPDTAPIPAALVKAGAPPYLPSDDR